MHLTASVKIFFRVDSRIMAHGTMVTGSKREGGEDVKFEMRKACLNQKYPNGVMYCVMVGNWWKFGSST